MFVKSTDDMWYHVQIPGHEIHWRDNLELSKKEAAAYSKPLWLIEGNNDGGISR